MPSTRSGFIAIITASVVLAHAVPLRAADAPSVLTDYRITSWSGGDGVTLGPVQAIVQDHDGYLWLASQAGLVRFDGFRFATTDIVFGATKLPAAPTRAVYLAHDNSLWVGYGDGHGIYQIVNGEVKAVHLKGLFTGFVRAITEDRSGALWIGYDEGLYRLQNNIWDRVSMPLEGPDRRVFDIHEDRAGTLWVGTAAGLYRRTPDGTFEKGDDTDANVYAIS
jgi:ligand-binding sensor domain-containing protein